MGVTFHYQPIKPPSIKALDIDPLMHFAFASAMCKAFESRPEWWLDSESLPFLWDIARQLDDLSVYRAVSILTEEIATHGTIEVEAVY